MNLIQAARDLTAAYKAQMEAEMAFKAAPQVAENWRALSAAENRVMDIRADIQRSLQTR